MAVKKYSFNMQFDDAQKELFERLIEHLYPGSDIPKSVVIHDMILDLSKHILGFGEHEAAPIDLLIHLFKQEQDSRQNALIEMIGEEKYNEYLKSLEEGKKNE